MTEKPFDISKMRSIKIRRQHKKSKIVDIITEFEENKFTGQLRIVVNFNQGGISSLTKESSETIT